MNHTYAAIGTGLIIIAVLVFIGSGWNPNTPTPPPQVNPLIVASTTSTISTTPTTPTPEPAIPRSAFNTPQVFNRGYQKVFTGGLIVTMTDLADSRCKPDVQCIWAGEVSVSFTIVGGGISPSQTISLGTITKKSAVIGDYLITLSSADEAAATITVSKTADIASTTQTL